MKVVLLAAGRSVRMQPIPDKNFLKFCGKPLIVHQLEALACADFGEILIIGGAHNLKEFKKLSKNYGLGKAKIAVREQGDLKLGMAGALLSAASWIKSDPFLVVSSNDVLDKSAFELIHKNIKKGEGLLLAKKVKQYFPGGYLKVNSKNVISKIVEKPIEGKEPSKLVNIVMHYHPDPGALIAALKEISSTKDDRYECALQKLFDDGIKYTAVPFDGFWQPVKYPWHVITLMNYFLENCVPHKAKAEIAKSAVIRGNVYFEDGARVLENAAIQGPAYIGRNTVIATNALVRQSHIGANCVIGFGSEVARSYVGDGVWTHTNYIGDSVIGDDVSFGAGAVTGNLRLDEKNIMVRVNSDKLKSGQGELGRMPSSSRCGEMPRHGGAKIDCGSNKFGLITGNHIRVGVNTSFMPGVKIGSNSFIGAGIVVAQDIPESSFATGDWDLKIKPNREKITPRPKP